MSLHLEVEARIAKRDEIEATGRDAELCGRLEGNLIFATYRKVLESAGKPSPPLRLSVQNEIPLGMGCGSSAAARLAGVALANHFGDLRLDGDAIVAEASRQEGHPDNVAACWFGGYTVSVPTDWGVAAATIDCDATWQLLLALPAAGLATEAARAVLPEQLSRTSAVFNVQRVALLTAAFAQGNLSLLRVAMEDRMHQPQRRAVCGLLEHLHTLHHAPEFAGVALSGAGPALLAVLAQTATLQAAEAKLRVVLGAGIELLPVRIAGAATIEPL